MNKPSGSFPRKIWSNLSLSSSQLHIRYELTRIDRSKFKRILSGVGKKFVARRDVSLQGALFAQAISRSTIIDFGTMVGISTSQTDYTHQALRESTQCLPSQRQIISLNQIHEHSPILSYPITTQPRPKPPSPPRPPSYTPPSAESPPPTPSTNSSYSPAPPVPDPPSSSPSHPVPASQPGPHHY